MIVLIVLIGAFSKVPSGSLSGILVLCIVGSRRIGLGKIFTRLGGSPGRFSVLRLVRVVAWVVVRVIGMFEWMFKKV